MSMFLAVLLLFTKPDIAKLQAICFVSSDVTLRSLQFIQRNPSSSSIIQLPSGKLT